MDVCVDVCVCMCVCACLCFDDEDGDEDGDGPAVGTTGDDVGLGLEELDNNMVRWSGGPYASLGEVGC